MFLRDMLDVKKQLLDSELIQGVLILLPIILMNNGLTVCRQLDWIKSKVSINCCLLAELDTTIPIISPLASSINAKIWNHWWENTC